MFRDSVCHNFSILCHRIHLHLLGMFNELADNHRMLLRRWPQVAGSVPSSSCWNKRSLQHLKARNFRANQHGETYFFHKLVDVVHARKLAPASWIYADTIQHGRELLTVFGIVNALGGCPQDIHTFCASSKRRARLFGIIGRRWNDHAVRVLQLEDIHHTLEGKLIEIKTDRTYHSR